MKLLLVGHVAGLFGKNRGGFTFLADVEEHQSFRKRFPRCGRTFYGLDFNLPVFQKANEVQASKRSRVLILLANRGFHSLNFNFTGRSRQMFRTWRLASPSVQGVQKPQSKGAARTQARTSRDVRK